jgi:hypothetical protein
MFLVEKFNQLKKNAEVFQKGEIRFNKMYALIEKFVEIDKKSFVASNLTNEILHLQISERIKSSSTNLYGMQDLISVKMSQLYFLELKNIAIVRLENKELRTKLLHFQKKRMRKLFLLKEKAIETGKLEILYEQSSRYLNPEYKTQEIMNKMQDLFKKGFMNKYFKAKRNINKYKKFLYFLTGAINHLQSYHSSQYFKVKLYSSSILIYRN